MLNEQFVAADRGELVKSRQTFAASFDRWLAERRPHLAVLAALGARVAGEELDGVGDDSCAWCRLPSLSVYSRHSRHPSTAIWRPLARY